MSAPAYYNEIDPYAAQWLRNLIAAGHIAPGVVDERSIVDVRPSDLVGYQQCHFFAGIGVWSYALRRAGWSESRPVWTGSCPCQPFSAAGKGGGFADERHLWPAFYHLICECRPPDVLGEQVASRDGLQWLDLVQDDLEGADYAFGAVDTSSALHGAPHIRQRLRWVAYAPSQRRHGSEDTRRTTGRNGLENSREARGMAHANGGYGLHSDIQRGWQHGQQPQDGISVRSRHQGVGHNGGPELDRPGPTNGFWRNPDWLCCRDGWWRPVESGTFPLAHGAPARVGRLRAYGNAVDAEATTAFIEAVMTAPVAPPAHGRT